MYKLEKEKNQTSKYFTSENITCLCFKLFVLLDIAG